MQTRREIVDLSTRDLLPNALAERICRALAHAIPNDGYRLFGLDPTTRLINRTLTASDSDTVARREWLQSVYLSRHTELAIDFSNTIGAGISLAAYHEVIDDCYGLSRLVKDRIEPDVHRRLYHETGTPPGGVIFANFGSRGR